jgi:hypothetical protein
VPGHRLDPKDKELDISYVQEKQTKSQIYCYKYFIHSNKIKLIIFLCQSLVELRIGLYEYY